MRIGSRGLNRTCAGNVNAGKLANVGPHFVVLARDPGLQFGQLIKRVFGSLSSKQLATGLKAQIYSGERLNVAVVQRTCDRMLLRARLEFAHMRFECGALLSDETNQISRDR